MEGSSKEGSSMEGSSMEGSSKESVQYIPLLAKLAVKYDVDDTYGGLSFKDLGDTSPDIVLQELACDHFEGSDKYCLDVLKIEKTWSNETLRLNDIFEYELLFLSCVSTIAERFFIVFLDDIQIL